MKRTTTRSMFTLVMVITMIVVQTATVSAATTWTVDDDWQVGDPPYEEDTDGDNEFATIQAAIDAATSGDTVLVAAGNYNESITLKQGVIVQGAGASVTTIDGGSSSAVSADGVDSTAVLDGFTITCASYSGGISNSSSSPTITNNIITGNYSGIINGSSSPTITNNTFISNGWGGIVNYSSSPTITNNTFTGNPNGVYNNSSSPTITSNTFTYNTNGIMSEASSSPTITNNIITGNYSGIINGDSSPTITNNTIASSNWGGIVNYSSSPTITNNIITSNGYGIYNSASSPAIDYNDVWGNFINYYECVAGPNDISADPLCVNPNPESGDYHLQSSSPCIDVGYNYALALPSTDFEGDPRIWPSSGTVDMGADEFISDNEGPSVSNVVATLNPAEINTSVTLTATVSDEGTGGSNIKSAEYSIDGGGWMPMQAEDFTFGDEVTEDVTVTFSAPALSGLYNLCVRGTDEFDNTGDSECITLVAYDPVGGFVTGGGWIDSPEGAYIPDSNLVGKATFGFVSKYNKKTKNLEGNAEFQFKVADLNFHSSSYDWLIITQNDTNAQFKGLGTIAGEDGEFKFMLWAGDGEPDTFRIEIWTEDVFGNKTVFYDNGWLTGLNQVIGGGSIIIHTGN